MSKEGEKLHDAWEELARNGSLLNIVPGVQYALDEPWELTGSGLQKVIERFLAANFPPHLRSSLENSAE